VRRCGFYPSVKDNDNFRQPWRADCHFCRDNYLVPIPLNGTADVSSRFADLANFYRFNEEEGQKYSILECPTCLKFVRPDEFQRLCLLPSLDNRLDPRDRYSTPLDVRERTLP
jgi:hypothetical protein